MIFFWKKSVDFWHIKLTLKVRFRHFFTNWCSPYFQNTTLSMSILGQKSCILGTTIFKIPQPNWPVGTCWTCVWPSASPINSIKSVMVAWKVTKKNGELKEYKSRRNVFILRFNFIFKLKAYQFEEDKTMSRPFYDHFWSLFCKKLRFRVAFLV